MENPNVPFPALTEEQRGIFQRDFTADASYLENDENVNQSFWESLVKCLATTDPPILNAAEQSSLLSSCRLPPGGCAACLEAVEQKGVAAVAALYLLLKTTDPSGYRQLPSSKGKDEKLKLLKRLERNLMLSYRERWNMGGLIIRSVFPTSTLRSPNRAAPSNELGLVSALSPAPNRTRTGSIPNAERIRKCDSSMGDAEQFPGQAGLFHGPEAQQQKAVARGVCVCVCVYISSTLLPTKEKEKAACFEHILGNLGKYSALSDIWESQGSKRRLSLAGCGKGNARLQQWTVRWMGIRKDDEFFHFVILCFAIGALLICYYYHRDWTISLGIGLITFASLETTGIYFGLVYRLRSVLNSFVPLIDKFRPTGVRRAA
ncbi:transmembrane protein 40 [Rhynochetos jubatus]